MDLHPRRIVAAGAVTAGAFLGLGAWSAASADDIEPAHTAPGAVNTSIHRPWSLAMRA